MARDGLEAHPISRTSGQPGCSLFPGGGAVACFRFFFWPGTYAAGYVPPQAFPASRPVGIWIFLFFALSFLLSASAACGAVRQAGRQSA